MLIGFFSFGFDFSLFNPRSEEWWYHESRSIKSARNSSAGEPPSNFDRPCDATSAKTSGECAQDWQQTNGVISRAIGGGRFESLAIEDAQWRKSSSGHLRGGQPRGNAF